MNLDFQLKLSALQTAVVQAVEQQLVARRVTVAGIFQYPFDGLANPRSAAVCDHLSIDAAQIVPTSPTGAPPFAMPFADVTIRYRARTRGRRRRAPYKPALSSLR